MAYEGSHQQYDAIYEKNVMIPARDGVRLATDIYFPAEGESRAEGRFNVILERTPYDKSAARQVSIADATSNRSDAAGLI